MSRLAFDECQPSCSIRLWYHVLSRPVPARQDLTLIIAIGNGMRKGSVRWESADEGRPKLLDLSLRPFRRTGVVYYHIGTRSFAVQRFLSALTGRKILLSPTAGHRPGQPHLPRRLDKHHFFAQFVPARLQQQRGIQDRNLDARRRQGLGLPLEQTGDFRMSQLFQVFSFSFGLRVPGRTRCGPTAPGRSARPARKPPLPIARRAAASTCGSRNTSCPARSASSTPAPSRRELPGHHALSARHSAHNADDSHSLVE